MTHSLARTFLGFALWIKAERLASEDAVGFGVLSYLPVQREALTEECKHEGPLP